MISNPDSERYCQTCGTLYYRKPTFGVAQWRELRTCGNSCASVLRVKSAEERFMANVMPEPNSGCWIWTGSLASSGYGTFFDGNIVVRAHRFSFEAFKRTLLPGEKACHRCDMPCCVNPEHLWAGTQKQNIRDMLVKGRHPGGPNKKLTADVVRLGRQQGLSPTVFSERFGVSIATAHSALRGKTWRHVQ